MSTTNKSKMRKSAAHSLSVVLPAWNEEGIIEQTIVRAVETLEALNIDYELIVVDDGSQDHTGVIADELAAVNQKIHVVHNYPNKGYGGALTAGFTIASKELLFFMDSDGQFTLADITKLLERIDEYDAVLGYRAKRQDSRLRLINAWGWNAVIRIVFGLRLRDVDCAFKLYRTAFIKRAQLQATGAMVNAELLVKLRRLGYTWVEVPITHLPRQTGKPSGASVRVIARAFGELIRLYLPIKFGKL